MRCREQEVSRVIDILLRHGKNNPTLVGPAGVGKTAIAEGLAQRVAADNVPLTLRNVRILSLDHVGLLAGTTYRGQFEERIRGIVAETTAATDVILFIDELHNLIGQGTAIGVPMDAANMLKPALVRGDFRVIGATTSDEYERWVGGDPALERRFQKVVVRELGELEALEILHARKERLERHHNVLISDEALRAAIKLTDLYVTDRMRPDKAIDALDEACAHMQAVTVYAPRAEELIKQRIALLKQEAKADREDGEAGARHAAHRDGRMPSSASAPSSRRCSSARRLRWLPPTAPSKPAPAPERRAARPVDARPARGRSQRAAHAAGHRRPRPRHRARRRIDGRPRKWTGKRTQPR